MQVTNNCDKQNVKNFTSQSILVILQVKAWRIDSITSATLNVIFTVWEVGIPKLLRFEQWKVYSGAKILNNAKVRQNL